MNAGGKKKIGWVILLISLILAGCGPSPEEQAATSVAQTKAAATSTPLPTSTPTQTPTPTPTPIPYDLSLLVIGEEDIPIVGVAVMLVEVIEEDEERITNDDGQVTWYDLPGETINLTISAQGYFLVETSGTIERGENQMTITLERDPYGLLPSQACAPGERLLYIEDFQDGEAQGWPSIEDRAQEWDIIPDPANPIDFVLFKPADKEGSAGLRDLIFDDAVWRLQFMPIGRPIFWFNLPSSSDYEVDETTVEWSAYQLFFHPPGLRSFRAQPPISTIFLRERERTMSSEEWHQLEISTYEGTLNIWIDGVLFVSYDDPKPLPGGSIHFGVGLGEPLDYQSVIYYDDFVICELTAPFVTKPMLESE
jgi:hypothetical protein